MSTPLPLGPTLLAFFTAICKFRRDHRCQYKLKMKKTSTDWLMHCTMQTADYIETHAIAVIDNQFQKNLFFLLKSMLIDDDDGKYGVCAFSQF